MIVRESIILLYFTDIVRLLHAFSRGERGEYTFAWHA
jgi:hypothetical protein